MYRIYRLLELNLRIKPRKRLVRDKPEPLSVPQPVSASVVESVLSRHIDDLEPTLTRHGYRTKDLVELFDTKATEIKAMFNNTLEPARSTELREKMLRAGLPI